MSDLTVRQATAIISEMRQRGAIKDDMPEDDAGKLALAGAIVKAAEREWEKGNRGPDITVVANIVAAGDTQAPAEAPSEPVDEPKPTEPAPVAQAPQGPPGAAQDGSQDSETTAEIKQRVTGFPIPLMVPDPGPFPPDLTKLSMTDIRRLAGEWNRVYASAVWNLSLEESSLLRAEQIWENKRGVALSGVPRKDEDGKARLAAAIEAEVNSDPDVREWKNRVVKHETFVRTFKALVRIYEANIDRLSREITARQAEEDKNRLADRKP